MSLFISTDNLYGIYMKGFSGFMSPASKLNMSFRNEDGAIDLSSIMVGIIVIGFIGGVIAATVFAVIPWAQDNAAKQQLQSISSAQASYKALSSDPSKSDNLYLTNSYANSRDLDKTNLLSNQSASYCTIPINEGAGYIAFAKSSSGKFFRITDTDSSPKEHTITPQDLSYSSCATLDFASDYTILTYNCDVTSAGMLPFRNINEGKLVVKGSDGSEVTKEYQNVAQTDSFTFEAGVEYKVLLEGTYKHLGQWTSNGQNLDAKCIRGLDYWGEETGVTTGNLYGASNLVTAPRSIPSTITTLKDFFNGATVFNDSNVSQWDVSNVTDTSFMFYYADSFNQPLESWNVSNVTNFRRMFYHADIFNQPLNNWDVSSANDLSGLFENANRFNQPLDKWDVSNATKLRSMFYYAVDFNQPLHDWDVSNATDIEYMFYKARNYNQDLSSWVFKSQPIKQYFYEGSGLAQEHLPPAVLK